METTTLGPAPSVLPPEHSYDRRWIRPSRILLATDLTDLERTLPIAIHQSRIYGADLMIAHVLPNFVSPPAAPSLLVYSHPETFRDQAERLLTAACAQAQSEGVRCSSRLLTGDVAEQIDAAAEEWRAERVIVGSHGEAKFCLGILGSVSERLFHRLAVPVLAVGPKTVQHSPTPSASMRVLAPTSLKRESRAVLQFAGEFAAAHQAEITLLHVVPEAPDHHPSANRVASYARQMLEEFSPSAAQVGKPACVVDKGNPITAILRHAKAGDFDMILLGSISSSSFLPALVPGTVYGILCGARCPVLILKQQNDVTHPAELASPDDKDLTTRASHPDHANAADTKKSR
jgi:nucleotide-binding universal stress UspA family protein